MYNRYTICIICIYTIFDQVKTIIWVCLNMKVLCLTLQRIQLAGDAQFCPSQKL